ncbi:MAG: flagellar basal-body MS-ring/collar protein FliF [Steroidobacteraceae bacterium]
MAADPAALSNGMANSLTAGQANVSANLAALPATLRPLLLLIGIAAAVAAGVWIVLWSRGPTYSLLYANLSPQDEAQVAQALDAAQIPYKLDAGTNGIEVPAERLDEARLKLAGQGVTDSDSFAALEKNSGFGVSQFMEDVRYQHALEMELARTIASMQPVAGARVNLAEPQQSVFVSDNRSASASVFVQLRPGSTLEPEQVQAIVNLVASSVQNLSPGEVTVVDQQGHLLSAPSGHDAYASDEREYDMVHRMETDYARRIEALLTPLVGPGLVHAQVVAELNLGVSEQAKELYTPNSQIVRSEQLSQQSAGSAATGGVPGSLSNEPPAPGVIVPPSAAQANAAAGQNGAAASGAGTQTAAQSNGAQSGAAAATAGTAGQPATQPVGGTVAAPGGDRTVSSDVTRNYEIDRTLDYSRQPAGTVRRLTVAVLIGDRTITGPDGKVTKVPLSAQDLTRVTQLVKDAVGFDATRGDSVSVVNESLDTGSAPAAEGNFQATPLWQSPFAWSLLRIVAGLVVVLVLVLSVLRPLVRTLITPMRLAPAATAGTQALPTAGSAAAATLSSGQREAVVTALTHDQQLAQARTLVNQDPKRVAQVVRGWVGSDE